MYFSSTQCYDNNGTFPHKYKHYPDFMKNSAFLARMINMGKKFKRADVVRAPYDKALIKIKRKKEIYVSDWLEENSGMIY